MDTRNTESKLPLTLVIDQGTSSTRALALNRAGKILAAASRNVTLKGHGSALVEQDANEIIASVNQVVQTVLADSTVRRLGVACAGLATQRSSVVAWDKRNGKPLGPLLSWQDRRAAKWLNGFGAHAEKIKERTGLQLSPHYGASKLRWYLDHLPTIKQASNRGYLAFGPLASFLLFHLMQDKPLLVDHANASRTQLWNLKSRDWDPWLLDLFGIPPETLPICHPTCHNYGFMRIADVPVTAVNGDQTAAVYSLGKPRPDTALVNIGTGAFILISTATEIVRHPALLSGLARSTAGWTEYIIEGTVNGAGAALDWAAKQWGLSDITSHLATGLSRRDEPPLFVNTIGGLGSPWWQPGPSPTLVGSGEPRQMALAVAESILFMLKANLEAMAEAGLTVARLQISGGLARFDGLCHRLAALTKLPVYRPAETEATCRGIAWLAAGFPHRWPKPGRGRLFKPRVNQALNRRYRRFRQILG